MSAVYVDDEALSDEDYLISQAKRCLHVDPSAAKSWIITAKSLFPNNFNIQYEAYQMACGSENVKEAALFFGEMMKTFRNEPILWAEMQKMADALRVESKTDDIMFLRDLFSQLPVDIQHEMLVSVAGHCEDTMEHCRLLLLLLQKFPNRSYQHGMKLIDTLFSAEKHSRCSSPVNKFRRLLVCDVLPLILTSSNFIIPAKLMFRLLSKAIEFYVSYVTSPVNKDQEPGTRCDDRCKIDDPIQGPWLQLFKLMEIAGQNLNWELCDIFTTDGNFTLSELNWQRILAVLHKKSGFSEPADMSMSLGGGEDMNSHIKEVFFCASVVYFYCLCQFGKLVYPEWFIGSSSGDTHYILIEGIQSQSPKEEIDLSKSKKRKIDGERDADSIPQLVVSRTASSETASVLTQSFVTAIKCWELLHSTHHSIKKEFSRLSQHLRMEEWPWYQEFFIGTIIYQGFHKDAITRLFHTQSTTNDDFVKNKTSLQLASCLYYIGDFSRACKSLFDVICSFPHVLEPSPASPHMEPLPKRSGHHLHFIAFKQREILQYCVKLLITIFKEKALQAPVKDSMMLGHLIVLLQYDWPQEESLFLQCVDVIKKQGNFCYGLFFNYVINSDILEEFMYLTTTAGGAVSLDLLPTSTVQIGKQRAVTRGVNKGAKEDLKGSMEKQMSRCEEDLDSLLISFIKQEKDLLIQNIM